LRVTTFGPAPEGRIVISSLVLIDGALTEVAVRITGVGAETHGGTGVEAHFGGAVYKTPVLVTKLRDPAPVAGERLQVTPLTDMSFETDANRPSWSLGLRVTGANGLPVKALSSDMVIGEKGKLRDAEIFGLVIEVAVTVTLVGLATTEGAVYFTLAVSVEGSNVGLLSVPKLRGEADQTTPWLLWS
jgi:hypothetical protein